MTFLKSLVGKATAVTCGILFLCLAALTVLTFHVSEDNAIKGFQQNSITITRFLSDQVNAGTRLKRDSMVEPQISAALSQEGIRIDAVRIVHVDGTEVLRRSVEGASPDVLSLADAPDFESPVSGKLSGERYVVRSPIVLGAGADSLVVGELALIWNAQDALASVNSLRRTIGASFAATLVLMMAASAVVLRRLVARPLRQTIDAMHSIADEREKVVIPKSNSAEMSAVSEMLAFFQSSLEERRLLEAREAEARAEAEQSREIAAKEEREEQVRREQEATAARETAERDAARAKGLLEDLSEAIDRAKAGEFSARVKDAQSAGEADRIRSIVNDLMSVVEEGLQSTSRVIDGLSKRDLTVRMTGEFSGDFERLQSDVNQMAAQLEDVLYTVADSSREVEQVSNELDGASKELARRTEKTASSIAETSEAVEQFSKLSGKTAENASNANEKMRDALQQAGSTNGVVTETVTAMNEISDASQQIANSVSIINDISFQTNLLALNAGVEAARAGEAGRGFAVVASEVRALAQRCSEAAREIEMLIEKSTAQVSNGVKLVGDVNGALTKMSQSINEVAQFTDGINSAASEQATSAKEISSALLEVDRATQQNAAMNEEIVAVVSTLAGSARQMMTLVGEFRLSKSVGRAASSKSVDTAA